MRQGDWDYLYDSALGALSSYIDEGETFPSDEKIEAVVESGDLDNDDRLKLIANSIWWRFIDQDAEPRQTEGTLSSTFLRSRFLPYSEEDFLFMLVALYSYGFKLFPGDARAIIKLIRKAEENISGVFSSDWDEYSSPRSYEEEQNFLRSEDDSSYDDRFLEGSDDDDE